MFALSAEATKNSPMDPSIVIMLLVCGAFAVLGAWRNLEWYLASPPAPMVVTLFGRNGARIFYLILGSFILAGTVLRALGVIH